MPPFLPNGRLCYCPGAVETYTCIVSGGALTDWLGTAFDCTGNAISLIHSRYSAGTAVADCGALTGRGTAVDTSVDPTCYTSELSVPISPNLDGLFVNCSRDAVTSIGSHILKVAGTCCVKFDILFCDIFSPYSSTPTTHQPDGDRCWSVHIHCDLDRASQQLWIRLLL